MKTHDLAVDVADLLQRSRAAHQTYLFHTPRMAAAPGQPQPQRHAGDATQARKALVEARELRTRAHALDPQHTAPAWAADVAVGHATDTLGTPLEPHDEILAFYESELKPLN